MSNNKQRKDIDKAVKNLVNYAEQQAKWKLRLEDVFDQMLLPAAQELGIEEDILIEASQEDGYWNIIFGYIFEDFASATWDDEEHSFIDEYLKRRGWREAPIGRRYLKAINDSEVELWELTAVKPGFYADVRLYGSDEKPIRVIEKSATESLQQWDCLAGRVIQLDKANLFTGALLPIPLTEIQHIQQAIENTKAETRAIFNKLLEDGEIDALPDNLEQEAEDDVNAEFPEILLRIWIVYLYRTINQGMPSIQNTEGEAFQFITVRFPLKASSKKISHALDEIPQLDRNPDESTWICLPRAADNIEEGEAVSIQGHIFLKGKTLELQVNSNERAESGSQWLAEKLGKLVGTPLLIHENLSDLLENTQSTNSTMDISNTEEEQALMTSYMDKHYQETLDESIPMLNDKTPRECASDPKLHKDVVQWLKYMENQSNKEPQPSYDFAWIWEELGLEKYKP